MKIKKFPISTFVFMVSAVPSALFAQQPATTKTPTPQLSLSVALAAAQEAVSACAANGYNVAVTVIDSAGDVKVTLRADGISVRAVEYATRKANTSLKYGESSLAIQEKVNTDPEMGNAISADPTLLARGGALPLISRGNVIGAIGVGGAPGGEKDDVCTMAAVKKVAGMGML